MEEVRDGFGIPSMPIFDGSAEPVHVRNNFKSGPPAGAAERLAEAELDYVFLLNQACGRISVPKLAITFGL